MNRTRLYQKALKRAETLSDESLRLLCKKNDKVLCREENVRLELHPVPSSLVILLYWKEICSTGSHYLSTGSYFFFQINVDQWAPHPRQDLIDFLETLLIMSECREKIGYEWYGIKEITRQISDEIVCRITVIDKRIIQLRWGDDESTMMRFLNREGFLERVAEFERKHLTMESLVSMTPFLKSMVVEGETV